MTLPLLLFHNQGKGRPVGGGGEIIQWLLRDDFNDTLTAGNVNGTAATPGPGTRTVVDGSGQLSLSSGNLVIAGADATPAYGNPGLWHDETVTRAAGLVLVYEVNHTTFANARVGFDTNQSGGLSDNYIYFTSTGELKFQGGITVGSSALSTSTSYKFATILKSTGAYHFIKGGAYTDWTLLWMDDVHNNATLYTAYSNYNAVFTSSFLRVPDETWLPTPLAYTEFTAANGTSLDALPTLTTGPDSQAGVTARSWTEQSGAWDIQSNRANPDGAALATVDTSQADIVVDLVVNGGAAGQPGILLRFADTSNYWYLQADRANNQLELHEVNATVDTVRANAAVTINDSTDYTLRAICDGTTIDGFLDGGNKISYGSASLNQTETEHGLYSDNTACEFDDLAIFARDSGYSKLDSYTS